MKKTLLVLLVMVFPLLMGAGSSGSSSSDSTPRYEKYFKKGVKAQNKKDYEEAVKADRNHDEALEYQGELYLWWGYRCPVFSSADVRRS